MSRCNHCSPVPEGVRQAAGLLEGRWTVSILWASYAGASRFNEFKQAVGEIPPRTLAQLALMAQIAAASDDTIGALATRAGLDQSTLSRNLRGLEAEGLIEIAIVESDLRRRAVWLTETGARRLEKAIPVWRRANEKLSRQVSTDLLFRLVRETDELSAP